MEKNKKFFLCIGGLALITILLFVHLISGELWGDLFKFLAGVFMVTNTASKFAKPRGCQ